MAYKVNRQHGIVPLHIASSRSLGVPIENLWDINGHSARDQPRLIETEGFWPLGPYEGSISSGVGWAIAETWTIGHERLRRTRRRR